MMPDLPPVRYRGPKFAILPEWVLDAEISALAVRLYCVLRRYADSNDYAYPSRRVMAVRCKITSRPAIDRAVAELVAIGALATFARWRSPAGVIGDAPAPGWARTTNGYEVRG
jgi:hypothetical protein